MRRNHAISSTKKVNNELCEDKSNLNSIGPKSLAGHISIGTDNKNSAIALPQCFTKCMRLTTAKEIKRCISNSGLFADEEMNKKFLTPVR